MMRITTVNKGKLLRPCDKRTNLTEDRIRKDFRFKNKLENVVNVPSKPDTMRLSKANNKALIFSALLLCSLFHVDGAPLYPRRTKAETGNMTVHSVDNGMAIKGGADAINVPAITNNLNMPPFNNIETKHHNFSVSMDESTVSSVEVINEDWSVFNIVTSIRDTVLEIFKDAWKNFNEEDTTANNPSEKFLSYLERISETADKNQSRFSAIEKILRERGFSDGIKSMPYHSAFSYVAGGTSDGIPDKKVTVITEGVNLVVDAAPPEPGKFTLAITAHYDRVEEGKGAIDNASGCAAVIAILEEFKANPPRNLNIKGIFFGAEEEGLVGSTHYLRQCSAKKQCSTLYFNLDALGIEEGDTFILSGQELMHLYYVLDKPRSPDLKEQTFSETFSEVAEKHGFAIYDGKVAAQSDHLPFQRAGRSALGLSLTNKEDAVAWNKYQDMNHHAWNIPEPAIDKDPANNKINFEKYYEEVDSVFAKTIELQEKIPSLNTIHTKNDIISAVNVNQISKALKVIIETIKELDENIHLKGWL